MDASAYTTMGTVEEILPNFLFELLRFFECLSCAVLVPIFSLMHMEKNNNCSAHCVKKSLLENWARKVVVAVIASSDVDE